MTWVQLLHLSKETRVHTFAAPSGTLNRYAAIWLPSRKANSASRVVTPYGTVNHERYTKEQMLECTLPWYAFDPEIPHWCTRQNHVFVVDPGVYIMLTLWSKSSSSHGAKCRFTRSLAVLAVLLTPNFA
jgi:hypothetical protein